MHQLSKRLYPAIRLLVGPGTVKQRLAKVWLTHLDDIAVADMPGQIQHEFRELRRSMYDREPLPHESAPEASIRKMSIREATKHAECIVNILNILAEESGVAEVIEFRAAKRTYPTQPRTDKEHDQLLN
jgi:hypothetical protein